MAMTPGEVQAQTEDRAVVDTSGGWIRRLIGKSTRTVGLILLAFVAWVLVRVAVDPGAYLSFDPAILLAVGLVGGGVLLLRGQQPAYDEIDQVAVVPKPSSPLGILTLSVAFLTVGVLILVGNLGVADVTIGHIMAACLTVVAVGLVVGAWWGRSRVLIALGVVLVPLVIAGGFMHLPLRGTIGSRWVNTRSIDQVESRYELLGGTLNMHLSDLRNFSGERVIDISIAAGNATIFVPERIALTITGHIEFGNAAIGNGREEGADLVLSNSLQGKPGAGHLTINFTGGIASLYIERITYRQLHGPLPRSRQEKARRQQRAEKRDAQQQRDTGRRRQRAET